MAFVGRASEGSSQIELTFEFAPQWPENSILERRVQLQCTVGQILLIQQLD